MIEIFLNKLNIFKRLNFYDAQVFSLFILMIFILVSLTFTMLYNTWLLDPYSQLL